MRELIIKDFNNQVCIFQLTNLKDMDRINTYLKSLQDGSIILLGEYVINDFKMSIQRKEYEIMDTHINRSFPSNFVILT